jgi:D-beta-D-heptose 7-phosphate kinase/D-beta-D-heptose 1-phosphate adenosyltransferase
MKVWINGCFDVLHYGHFRLINYARSYGGELIIGIDSDIRIKESKGTDRPIHTAEQRKYNLLQLVGVSDVWVFDTDEELDGLIKNYQPDLFVIGDEYKYKPIIGYTHSKKVKFFDKIEGISTTKILNDEK